jgi:hypothetical protein
VKCDETKPTCEQCARRRITCGGYRIDVRWKQAPEPTQQSSPRRNKVASQIQRPTTGNRDSILNRPIAINNSTSTASTWKQPQRSTNPAIDDILDTVFSSPDIDQPASFTTPKSLGLLFPNFSQVTQLGSATPERVLNDCNSPPLNIDGTELITDMDYTSELWNTETFWEDYLRPLPMTPVDRGLTTNDTQTGTETPKDREDEAERIAYLFHQQTCRTLVMQEETSQNPWKALIWPLAKECPALYHAIAALTCFGMSQQQSQLRVDGARHVRRSMQLLSENVEIGEIPLDAALAATLTLGFAETWDDEISSNGASHIRGAGVLLHQVRCGQLDKVLSVHEMARVDFLANTWTYMDVIARFTSAELCQPCTGNIPLDNDLSTFSQQDQNRLDPRMGYSTTFFPIMRYVANLINKVRAREASRNSPAIISQAIELRRAIEQWTLPVDLEVIDDPSQLMTDAIQTAEAYRWSTLMILYQAVPELPNLTSYGELAQKILVYLATIPLSSTTISMHIFPLMIAGCDAVEEEDRQFVRERWQIMSQRTATGTVDRCQKLTEEIWKRREEYLLARGLSFTANGRQITTTINESTTLSKDIASFIDLDTSPYAQNYERPNRKTNDFPISAAFKKDVDILTRSGYTDYTVRGRLHWLGVMQEWGWQGKLLAALVNYLLTSDHSHARLIWHTTYQPIGTCSWLVIKSFCCVYCCFDIICRILLVPFIYP